MIIKRNYLSSGARELIWEIFFSSRHRGISLEFHFPWLNGADEKYTCFTIEVIENGANKTIAALVIINRYICNIGEFGFIGLVCVDQAYRGHGLSVHLIESAKHFAESTSLVGLLLWTNQPRLYEKVGFVVDSQDIYGTITHPAASSESHLCESEKFFSINVHFEEKHGVPAFAEEVIKFCSDHATATICKSKNNITLAGWDGDNNEIILLIEKILPKSWDININEENPLIRTFQEYGYSLDLKPSAKRMVFRISLSNFIKIPYISVLHRI